MYCLHGDSIHVTLAGVSLVSFENCQPKIEDGIVFQIIPIYLPRGFYEFEYSLRSKDRTLYMMASVLPESAPGQPPGLIRASHEILYLPEAVESMVEGFADFPGRLTNEKTVLVREHDFSGLNLPNYK